MNIQRLSESLYHIWHIRLEAQLLSDNRGTDFIPDDKFGRLLNHSKRVEVELSKVHFNKALSDRFEKAVQNIRIKIPYIKTINRSGLFVLPIVGTPSEIERRKLQVSADINSFDMKKKFIMLANEEFRNAFQ